MRDARAAWRSVRVRMTLAATVVVGLTMLAASFALVAAVRHQLVDKLQKQNRDQIVTVATKLSAGLPPDGLMPLPSGFVVVQDGSGRVVKTAGAIGGAEPQTILVDGPQLAAGETGNVVIKNDGTPFDVRYTKVATPAGPLTVFAGAPLDGIQRSVAALERALIAGFPSLLVVVAGLAWLATGRALQPVEAIRAEVEEISGGTLHRRVPEPDTGDEISRLAHTMNAMLDRLERSSERQRQFVSDASHELRSPVAAIRAHLEVGLAHPEAVDWPVLARKALDEEARLEGLVGDLLSLASADEQGAAMAGATEVDVAAVVRDEAARARRLPVTVAAGEPLVVSGRGERLGRVFGNLLDNATRHAATSVAVTVVPDGDSVRVTVDDDGPGIPVAERRRVFERFTRLDPSRVRAGGGAGLGLALAKAIVEQHHGTIAVDDAPAGGARLVVMLPLGPRP
ncbi:MAG TPA: ATP-binding protein [Acidimicrobiales bacterium]|nr:ATP-binding protein [Acidimicrobiales bacterium]